MHNSWYFVPIALGLFNTVTAASSNCSSNTWVNLATIPNTRQEHSTVAINDTTIAVVGGVLPAVNGGILTTDLVQFYDIPSDSWSTGSPTPYKVNHPNVAALDGKIYLLGGLVVASETDDGSANWTASAESYVYDPTTDVWTTLLPLPSGTERGSAIVGVHGDMIYIAGGMTVLEEEYQDSLTTVTAFNTSSGTWERLPPAAANLPEGRQHGTGGIINNTFYVVGGRWFSQLGVRDTVFELDLTNTTAGWRTSSGHMPTARGGISGGIVDGKIYTFGGEGNPITESGVFNQSEVFDTETEQWKELAPMALPRHGTSSVAIGNRIYIPGGGQQQDGKPVTTNGTTTYSHPSARLDAYCV